MKHRQLFAQVFIVGLALLCATGVSLASSTWSGPTASAPGGNTDTPLNTGASNQIKSGSLTVGTLGVSTLCIGTTCISSMPSGGTGQLSITTVNSSTVCSNGSTTVSCPNGYTVTGCGYTLASWHNGNPAPDTIITQGNGCYLYNGGYPGDKCLQAQATCTKVQ